MENMNLFDANKPQTAKVSGGCDIMGIDLGTTNSAVSVFTADTIPTLLPIGKSGGMIVPSCVKWNAHEAKKENEWTVGAEAYAERFMPDVIYSIKRVMGSGKTVRFIDRNDPAHFVDKTPAEVSSIILNHIKEQVAKLYRPITKCIITVPAYFDQLQMKDTISAAEMAGLECLQILKEPTSASFIYSLLGYAQSGSVLIYDLGGGTFDATHMTFLRKDAVPKKMATSLRNQYGIEMDASSEDVTDQYYSRVIGTYGDMHLGGDDIDRLFGDTVMKQQGIELSKEGRERVYLRCEAFKKMGVAGEDIIVEDKKIHLDANTLSDCVDAIFDRTMKIIEDIDMSSVSTIVLVGGSTKSPRLRSNLQSAFPGVEISAVLDPDATVALGAGSVSKAISNKKELDYSDVLPLPIGVLVDEKSVDVCLQKNTSMPYSSSRMYYTMHDNQERITVHVFQGLSTKPEKCTYLGRITVDGIPPKPAGDVCVSLSFILTGQGRLRVVSHVEGVDREEELVVDNIFSVAEGNSIAQAKSASFETKDDFEYMVVEAAGSDNKKVIDMLMERRGMEPGSGEVCILENKIFAEVFG